MRRSLYVLNVGLALLFGGAFGVLVLAPQVVERQVGARLEALLIARALERFPELRVVPDFGAVVRGVSQSKLAQSLAGTALGGYGERRYSELMQELTSDLRIFAATNLILFALAALALRRHVAGRSALVLSLILTASALAGTWCYVYGQDWLETLLFSSYFGYGYSALVALIATALCDIAFNNARVLRLILEGLATSVAHH